MHPILDFFLGLDGVIYTFIKYLYRLFLSLAGISLFNDSNFARITRNMYVVLSVVMLFVLAYALLKSIINPDEFSKGENSVANIVKNSIISLAIIALLPTVFDVAFKIQDSLLNADVINKIVLGDSNNTSEVSFEDDEKTEGEANIMSVDVLKAFLYEVDEDGKLKESEELEESSTNCDKKTKEYPEVMACISSGRSSFSIIKNLDDQISDDEIHYDMVFSSVAGIFVLWILLLTCFDLGIRVIKLSFFEIIAPIPAICRIMPNSEGKKVWSNWTSITIKTFLDVFMRIFVMSFGVLIIKLIKDMFTNPEFLSKLTGALRVFAMVFLIMGVIAFIRQAPKIIEDIFGINVKDMNLGLGGLVSRLAEGGALAAATTLGTGITSAVRNFNTNDGNRRDKFFSAMRGLGRGSVYGAQKGVGAKSFSDVKNGTSEANEKQRKKEEYYREFVSKNPSLGNRFYAGYESAIIGLQDWAGMNSVGELDRKNAEMSELQSQIDDVENTVNKKIDSERQQKGYSSFAVMAVKTDANGKEILDANGNFIFDRLYTTTEAKRLEARMEQAKNGTVTENGRVISFAEAQKDFQNYDHWMKVAGLRIAQNYDLFKSQTDKQFKMDLDTIKSIEEVQSIADSMGFSSADRALINNAQTLADAKQVLATKLDNYKDKYMAKMFSAETGYDDKLSKGIKAGRVVRTTLEQRANQDYLMYKDGTDAQGNPIYKRIDVNMSQNAFLDSEDGNLDALGKHMKHEIAENEKTKLEIQSKRDSLRGSKDDKK